jgi:hypothetical protein
MQHASSTLRKIFGNALSKEGADAPLLAWPLACGSKIGEKTSAVAYADGTLTVAVPDETWRRQLQSFSGQYLNALRQISPATIDKIEFVVTNKPEH